MLIIIPFQKNIVTLGVSQGDITAISCYLGFKNIKAYERNKVDYLIAQQKIASLFGRNDILVSENYRNKPSACDVLILVNCAYAEDSCNKEQYMSILNDYYTSAKNPRVFLLEVIDPSYEVPDKDFPMWIRLSEEDVRSMFPDSEISSIVTYKYPINKRSKKLYIIKHNS